MTWWMPEHPIPVEPTWEHVYVSATGHECLLCGEGTQYYLHLDIKMPYCTICLYFKALRRARMSFTRPPTESGFIGVPLFYCAEHAEHAPLISWLINGWLHASDAGDLEQDDDVLLDELLAAYDAA